MMTDPISIPAKFVETTITRDGERGRFWLAALPDVVTRYLERWALVADGLVMHGFMAIVLPVRREDGGRAVLKVSWLDDETRWEPHALAAWDGRGAVRLLDRDGDAGVMLLERLDPARSARGLDGVSAASVAGQVCRRLAVPAPPGLPRVADMAARWVEEIPAENQRLGRPFDGKTVGAVVATLRELGSDQPDLLLHGDIVFDNILQGDREPWLVIDPLGIVGEPAFDGAKLLSNKWSELTEQTDLRAAVRRRLEAFADGAEVDVERARRWAQARGLNDALWCREHQPEAVRFVDALVSILD
jgi:streptomycin 6-kinase